MMSTTISTLERKGYEKRNLNGMYVGAQKFNTFATSDFFTSEWAFPYYYSETSETHTYCAINL